MRLLLAEDEQYTRDGIVKSIDWAQLGIEKVYTAEDGLQGLEIARTYSPDIILADIRMPRMNGAEMASEIRRIIPNCAIVFMSGYSDRDYLKSAIRLSALDYVSKPLDLDELRATLDKAVKHIRQNSEQEALVSSVKQQELVTMLIQDEISQCEAMRLWKQSGLPEGNGLLLNAVLLQHEYSAPVTALIREIAGQFGIRVLVGRWDNFYLFYAVMCSKQKGLLEEFTDKLLNHPFMGTKSVLAVGRPVHHPLRLKEAFVTARAAYNRYFYHPDRRLFIGPGRPYSLDLGFNPVHEFSQLLFRQPGQVRRWVTDQFERFREYDGIPVELIQNWVFQMKTELSLLERNPEERAQGGAENNSDLWQTIVSLTSLDQAKEFLLKSLDSVKYRNDFNGSNSSVVMDVQRYVHLHHTDPLLTLEDIARHVNFSLTYLCGVFKAATGRTINQYLTDCRIRRAQLLLQTTHMRIHEVAEASGYSGSNYFIKIFRKSTGLTPQEYKKRHSAS